VMLWKILYSPYDAGALVIMVVALGLHALSDWARNRRARSEGRTDR
jgi:hypothetical protein